MPCEFLGVCAGDGENHDELFRNFCAQADALALGDDGGGDNHRRCPGDRPSLSLTLDRVDAFHVGALLALYEHRTAAQGWLYGVNSFDQFGVELGKRLAGLIESGDAATASTRALLARYRAKRVARMEALAAGGSGEYWWCVSWRAAVRGGVAPEWAWGDAAARRAAEFAAACRRSSWRIRSTPQKGLTRDGGRRRENGPREKRPPRRQPLDLPEELQALRPRAARPDIGRRIEQSLTLVRVSSWNDELKLGNPAPAERSEPQACFLRRRHVQEGSGILPATLSTPHRPKRRGPDTTIRRPLGRRRRPLLLHITGGGGRGRRGLGRARLRLALDLLDLHI